MGMYDLGYYELTLRNNSASGEWIAKTRWDFVSPVHTGASVRVLDYGAGVGWFRAWRPEWAEVDSFDIGAAPTTGIRHARYDLVCFWDVLEHLPDYDAVADFIELADFVAVTVPVRPPEVPARDWKHTKNGEHVRAFTKQALLADMARFGLEPIRSGQPECPPREDILSVLFKRRATDTKRCATEGTTTSGEVAYVAFSAEAERISEREPALV